MLFGIDRLSSEPLSLTPGYLTWHEEGLVGLWCSRVGVVPLAVPTNFYPPSGGNPHCGVGPPSEGYPSNGVGFTVASEWENPISGAVTLGLLEREIPIAELGLRVGKILVT